uniref:Uncharacterized protein n=1 Tax=Arundo donax TaxID=35708 RepID=A0A0A9FN22_ARUDO
MGIACWSSTPDVIQRGAISWTYTTREQHGGPHF